MPDPSSLPFLFEPEPVVWVQRLLGLGRPLPWRVVSLLGASWGVLLPVGIALWLWGRRTAYALLAVVAVEGVAKMVVNQLIHIPRPDAPAIVKYERIEIGSFPSGHVSTTAALWGYLSVAGRIPWALTATLVLLVGVGRMYLGLHYVADILGGILFAALLIGLVRRLWPLVRDWLGARPFGFHVAASLLALAGVTAGAFFYFGDSPFKWRAGGMVAGLAVGLPLEYRYVRYGPAPGRPARKAATVAIGLAGLGALAAVDLASGDRSTSLGFALVFLGVLWVVFVLPALLARAGWASADGPRREQALGRAAKGIGLGAALLSAVLAYGIGVEPRLLLDIREHEVRLPGLPVAWDGAVVAGISDFQAGMWLDNPGMMRRAVEEVVARRPAAVLLAGDFLYHAASRPGREIRQILDALRPLTRSAIPTFAVLGNHDWGLEAPSAEPNREAARMLRDSLAAAGIQVLHNRAASISAPGTGETLQVVGIGSRYAGEDVDGARALAALPPEAARIVLMHHPDSFAELPAGVAPLALAGHTHGGQVRLPFTPRWSWLTFRSGEKVHADGWIDASFGEAGNRLYVTRGIGMSLVPLRINCPPEVTYFTLRSP